MHGVQSSFPWLKDTRQFKECGERKVIVSLLLLLINLQARLVGMNQIRSVYFPALEMDSILEFLSH